MIVVTDDLRGAPTPDARGLRTYGDILYLHPDELLRIMAPIADFVRTGDFDAFRRFTAEASVTNPALALMPDVERFIRQQEMRMREFASDETD